MSAELPGMDRASSSAFVAAIGFDVSEMGPTRVTGTVELGPDQHTPWGVVHGGVYCAVVESAASIGASLAVADRGQFAVGVNNSTDFLRPVTAGRLDVVAERGQFAVGVNNTTDFLRPVTAGRVDVVAEPVQQGRTLQLWQVLLTRAKDGKLMARGQVRLQNVPLPAAQTSGSAGSR